MNFGSALSVLLGVALEAPARTAQPAPAESWSELWKLGGLGWIYTVNLIIWTGLFLYLLRLGKRIRDMEKGQ